MRSRWASAGTVLVAWVAAGTAWAGTPNTVTVDMAQNLGAFGFSLGRQVSSVSNSWNFGPGTLGKVTELDPVRFRIWLEFKQGYDVVARTPKYDWYYGYGDTYSSRSDILLVNWRTDYDPLVTGGSWTESDLVAKETSMLAHYKQRWPKITLLECENEPSDMTSYYAKYKICYRIVNNVNAMGLAGGAIQVGGPVTHSASTSTIGSFLDRYVADGNTAKKLDFIAYHQYLFGNSTDPYANKDNPAMVAGERAAINSLLSARGLSTSRAIYVTEMGIFPIDRESGLGFEADLLIQATGLASLQYYYAGQSSLVPFHWTLDHPDNDRKDMFVDTADGVARPYYNMMKMSSMLPSTRYRATSSTLGSTGLGVYGLAGGSSSRIAVMTWNYQWTGMTTYDSTITVSNLPSSFRTMNVQVERYRILTGQYEGDLLRVENTVIGPRTSGTYYGATHPLPPNELRLLVLTTTTAPVGSQP
jgi:hypothetical protein